jgi:hypothetical protein
MKNTNNATKEQFYQFFFGRWVNFLYQKLAKQRYSYKIVNVIYQLSENCVHSSTPEVKGTFV